MTLQDVIDFLSDEAQEQTLTRRIVCYGETEEALALELKECIGPTTTIRDERGKKR